MITINPQLKVINGHAYASSLDLAKHFRKRHKDVLKAVGNIILTDDENDFSRRNFALRDYKSSRGQIFPYYEMTRDGFALAAMSFTGKIAFQWKVKYITAFNELEAELNRRLIKNREFGQLKLNFPEVAETIEDGYPSMTVSYAIARLTELGLMIPPISRNQIISLIKRGKLQGFNDGRQWNIFADSFNRFLKMRQGQFS